MQSGQRRTMAFCESLEGMRREGPHFASAEDDVQAAAGQVYIILWVVLLSYGQNLAYPIARE